MPLYERFAQLFSIVRVMPRTRAKVLIFGGFLALAGYFLPWYGVGFYPPGGSMTVNGVTLSTAFLSKNGPDQADFVTTLNEPVTAALIHSISIGMAAALFVGAVIFLLSWRLPTIRTKTIFRTLHGIGHLFPMIGYVFSLYWVIVLGRITLSESFVKELGGVANAGQLIPYMRLYVAPGLWILMIGLLISFVGVYIGERKTDEIQERVATGAMVKRGCLDTVAAWISATFVVLLISPFILTPLLHLIGLSDPLAGLSNFLWGAVKALF